MSERPDVAGVLEALAALPDRTPEQLAAYAMQRSAMDGAARFHEIMAESDDEVDEEEIRGDERESILDQLAELKLSKAARTAIETALDADIWTEAS